MKIFYSAKTDTGKLRTENQDSFCVYSAKDYFFVCDGMGGGVAGDFASRYAVDVILTSFSLLTHQQCLDIVGEKLAFLGIEKVRPIATIKLANRALHNLTVKYPKLSGMGTTFTGVWFEKQRALLHLYNVGDSRVYRIRNGNIKLLTEDHSKIKELIDSGKMTEQEAKTAEIQSMITRALGIAPVVKVDYKTEIVKAGDVYILCTDGLNGELDDSVIRDIVGLHKPDMGSIVSELILATNNAGGRDNTTVIALYSQDEHNFVPDVPASVNSEIIVAEEENSGESEREDEIIYKIEKNFKVQVPKLATQTNIFLNPLVIAFILVLLGIAGVFTYSIMQHKEEKNIVELTGNISGIKLDIRTLTKAKFDEIEKADSKVFKLQILQDCIKNKEESTVPLNNVNVTMEDDSAQNKFIGLSGLLPLDIRLPKGKYKMTLTYPMYVVIDEDLNIKDFINIQLENSGSLTDKFVIMVPEFQAGGKSK